MIRVTRKHDGEEVYVNPDWVEAVTPEKGGGASIWFGGDDDEACMKVRESAAEVARAIDDDREASR